MSARSLAVIEPRHCAATRSGVRFRAAGYRRGRNHPPLLISAGNSGLGHATVSHGATLWGLAW